MLRGFLLPVALGATAVAAVIPAMASAQSYGVYVDSGRRGYYDDEDDRRAQWIAHQRWEQREQWQREQARRAYWQHDRWDRDDDRRRDWNRGDWDRRDGDRREWRGRDDDD